MRNFVDQIHYHIHSTSLVPGGQGAIQHGLYSRWLALLRLEILWGYFAAFILDYSN
jgi:hypothetical protein